MPEIGTWSASSHFSRAPPSCRCRAAAGRWFSRCTSTISRELVVHVAGLLGRRPLIVPVPIGVMTRIVSLWRLSGLPPRLTPEQVLRLGEDKAFGFEDARHDWGYAPRSWREGLAVEAAALLARPVRRA
jgi:hypothetical protein